MSIFKQDLVLDFVDNEFEQSVIKMLNPKKGISIHRNQIIRYGSSIPYDNFIKSKNIPEIFRRFDNSFPFDSVTINEYLEGQIINWHTDKGNNDIFIISLLCDNNIDFRKGEEEISVLLPRYSLYRMHDELRFDWEHHVKATERRISLVFRQS